MWGKCCECNEMWFSFCENPSCHVQFCKVCADKRRDAKTCEMLCDKHKPKPTRNSRRSAVLDGLNGDNSSIFAIDSISMFSDSSIASTSTSNSNIDHTNVNTIGHEFLLLNNMYRNNII